MKPKQSGVSTQGIVVARAIESEKLTVERIVYVPYARQMVPGWIYHLVKYFVDRGHGEGPDGLNAISFPEPPEAQRMTHKG